MARYGQDYSGRSHSAGEMTVGDYANGMPSIRIGEFVRSFLRQFKWLIPLFILGVIPAYILTKGIKRDYKGEGRVLVQLGSEYVYNDVGTTSQTQGLSITPDVIALNETGLMKNSEIIEQVIGQMISEVGEDRFAKDAFAKIRSAEASGNVEALANARVDLHKFVDKNYAVMPQAKSSIINVAFNHPDGDIAVRTTNAFIDAYLAYRRTIFVEGSGEIISEQRQMTEAELNKTEEALQKFLRGNGISNFESESTGASTRTENLRAELETLKGSLSEAEAGLATVELQLRQQPEEINLYVDDRAGQRVAQAELELKQLLAKYLPTSDPVRAKQAEISELKSLQTANQGKAIGGRRVGPNPVYQALLTRRNTLAALADSLREKEFTVERLLKTSDSKVRKLQNLSPKYNNLVRERNTLQQRLHGYTNKEQEALVAQHQAESGSENVHVISYATLPRKGRNMRKIIFALLMVGWGFTLFMIALLRVFLDPKLYNNSGGSYGSGSSSHNYGSSSGGRGYGRRNYDRSTDNYVPEPVPAPIPTSVPAPAPAYAPAAYVPAAYAAAHNPAAHAQPAYDPASYTEPGHYPDHQQAAGQAQPYDPYSAGQQIPTSEAS